MILVVDDEKQYVENLISELEMLAVQVTFCPGVDEALNALSLGTQDLDAIVCDMMMPHGKSFTALETESNKITGFKFAQKVRSLGLRLPVILLTYLDEDRYPIEDAVKKLESCLVIRKRDKWSFEIAESIRDFVEQCVTR